MLTSTEQVKQVIMWSSMGTDIVASDIGGERVEI